MEKDLISIVVPVYNVEKYLAEAVDSIINQSYTNLEIILVDDGSTDNSGNICDDYAKKDSRIKVIHKENGGLSDARNVGAKAATGKFIQFTDSDDYLDKDMIAILHKDIVEYDADICLSSLYFVKDGQNITDASGEGKLYTTEEAVKENLLDKKIRNYAWNKLYKKSLFDTIQYPKGRLFEDILTTPKLFLMSEKIYFDDRPLYYYRQREGSILHYKTKENELNYLAAVFEISDYIRDVDEKYSDYCDYAIANSILNTYNDVGLNDMTELFDDAHMIEAYNRLKEIFSRIGEFILENSEDVKGIHYKLLLENREEYLKNMKSLPEMYPEN